MTAIVWDGTTLAADKRGCEQNLARTVTKLHRAQNGNLLGFCGILEQGLHLVDWYNAGADPAEWPAFQTAPGDDWTVLVVVTPTGVFTYGKLPIRRPLEDPFMAWGSGRELAIGAMAAGADARTAVEIAARFDTGVGNGIDTLRLE